MLIPLTKMPPLSHLPTSESTCTSLLIFLRPTFYIRQTQHLLLTPLSLSTPPLSLTHTQRSTTNREASIKEVCKELSLDEPTVKDELTRMVEAGFLKQLRTRGRYAIQDTAVEETKVDKRRTAPSAPRKRTREERQVCEETVEDTIEEFDSDPTSASAALAGANRLGNPGQPKLVLQKGGSRGSSTHSESIAAAPLSRAAEEPISLSQTSDGDNPKKRKRSVIKDPIFVNRAANKLENENTDEASFKEPFPYSQ